MAEMAALMFSVLVCFNVAAVYAKEHVVGGASNWALGVDYNNWASKETFVLGDLLVFNYGLSHNVIEVDKDGYDNCDGSNSKLFYDSRPAIVPLISIGPKYYICSKSDHCSVGGMKFTITVQIGNPGDLGPLPTIPSFPNTPPATSLIPGGAAEFLSENYLLIAFSLVLTTFFAFMKGSTGLH